MLQSASGDYVVLLARSILSRLLTFARSILVVPLISPAAFAQYRYISVVAGYLNQLHLGLLDVLAVRYPRVMTAGHHAQAAFLLKAAFQLCLVGGIIGGCLMFILATTANVAPRPFVILISIVMFFQLPDQFIKTRLRVETDFRRLARLDMSAGVLCLIAVLLGTIFWGYRGLLLTAFLVSPLVVLGGRDLLFPGGWRQPEFRQLAKPLLAGTRLWSAGVGNELAATLDIFLLTYILAGDRTQLGHYAFAALLAYNVTALANAISQVELIRISERAGRTPDLSHASFMDHVESAFVRDGLIAALISFAVLLCAAILVPVVLSDYVPALPLMGILAIASVPRRWRKYGVHVTTLADRVRWSNLAAALSLATAAGGFAGVHFLFADSLIGYALVTLATELIPSLVLLLASIRVTGAPRSARSLIRKVLAANAPLTVLAASPVLISGPIGLVVGTLGALFGVLVTFSLLYPAAVRDARVLVAAAWYEMKVGIQILLRRRGPRAG